MNQRERHPDEQDPQKVVIDDNEELQQLMQLPFSQIDLLPAKKKEAVYAEIGRQIALETPEEISTFMDEMAQRMADTTKEMVSTLKTVSDEFAAGLEALHTMGMLIPYIEKEYNSNKDKYIDTEFYVLVAAAAALARADGKEIPPLKAETEAEQMRMQLDLPPDSAPGEKGWELDLQLFNDDFHTDRTQAETVKEEPATIKEDTPATLVEKLKKMPILNPQAHIMPNNPLMNVMQQSGAINAGELALLVIPAKGRQKEISAYTIVNYEPGETDITITDPKLTEYERNVSNAIISLWMEAEKLGVEPVFTTDTIYRAMPGGGGTASPQQKGAITRASEKFRRIHMTIDATNELRKRGVIKDSETFKLDDYYFNAARAERTSKHSGQSVTAYQMLGKPVILRYAEMTGQILSVPAKHLTIRKIDKSGRISTELVTMNADRQAITGYMMRRIAVMKHDLEAARDRLKSYERKRKQNPEQELPEKPLAAFRQQSNTILFDTLFAQVGISTKDRKQLMLHRNFCYEVLEYWKATDFIKGYAEQKKGRKITGIIIET